MSPELKSWLADWLPPHLRRLIKRWRGGGAVSYVGNYDSWEAARAASTGYQDPIILEKVRDATAKVVRGEAAGERDSVLFHQVPVPFPLLAGLLRAASSAGNRLCVLDLGGSLGSTYHQCRGLLDRLDELRWNIVEQPSFVQCGREHFETEELRFFNDVPSCLAEMRVDVVILSGVLPYVERPYALLDEIVASNIENVILDRTPLVLHGPDRLTVQRVPPHIYGRPLSYPAWILNRANVVARFAERYNLVLEFDALAGLIDLGRVKARDTGFLFESQFDDD